MSGAEIAWNAAQSVTNAIAGRMANGAWRVIVARLKGDRRSESLGGSTEQRQEAYSLFRRSVIEYRTFLAGLAATPPRFVGALWSVPLHLRLLHRMPDLSADLLDHFLGVHTVGRGPTIEAANTLLTRLSSAVDAFSEMTGRRPTRQASRFAVELTKVDEALADFTLAVRGDLGFGDMRAKSGSASVRQPGQG